MHVVPFIVLPEPIEMIKVEKHEKPNTFILKNIKPVFKKGSSGEICINATSIGWPTPKYEWFIKHHEQEDDKYIKITNNLACTYVKVSSYNAVVLYLPHAQCKVECYVI